MELSKKEIDSILDGETPHFFSQYPGESGLYKIRDKILYLKVMPQLETYELKLTVEAYKTDRGLKYSYFLGKNWITKKEFEHLSINKERYFIENGNLDIHMYEWLGIDKEPEEVEEIDNEE